MPDQLAECLRDHVARIAGQPRPPGSAAHAATRAYVRSGLEQAGFTVEEEPTPEGGINLLTRPSADADRPLFILGAHYDSITTSPGADDNASAVAALLELARVIGPAADGSARLQLVAYDLEEFGLLGSAHHARRLRTSRAAVRGMISLEMLGYCAHGPGSQHLPPVLVGRYPDVGDFIGVVGNGPAAGLVETVVAAMRTVPGLPVEAMVVPDDGRLLPETRLSDHSSFWDHGYPALMITDTSFYRNPHYHRPTDTPDTLDYDFLARVTRGAIEAVRAALI